MSPEMNDGSIRAVDPVGERMLNRRMVVDRSCHPDAIVAEDFAGRRDLVRPDERRERCAALVRNPRLDVEGVRLEQQPRHLLERGRPVHVHGRQPRRPSEQPQRSVPGVVVRMLMRDEDRAKLADRQLRERELPRDAVSAVDQVDAIVDDDGLRRRGAAGLRRWPPRCAEQDQTRSLPVCGLRLRERRRGDERRTSGHERATGHGPVCHAAIIGMDRRPPASSRRCRRTAGGGRGLVWSASFDRFVELLRDERLREVVVHAGSKAPFALLVHRVSGHRDNAGPLPK